MTWMLLLSTFNIPEKWGTEMLGDVPKATPLVGGGAGIQTF